ncbi:MAG: helix-turn-helix domain-containing protein [Acidiferrobacterales bacterium]|nr:helix-turn-helix domain-containing protein [Acidiferrobacterales bacterium]
MSTMMQILAWLSAFACGLMGVHLLRSRPSNPMPAKLLGTLFLVMAIQASLISMVIEFGRGTWSVLLPSLALSLGPLLFLYFESVAHSPYRLTAKSSLHFLPATFCLGEMVFKQFWIDPDLMIVVSFGVYALALAWRMAKGKAQFSHCGVHQNIVFLWLVSCVALLALSCVNEVFIVVELSQGKRVNQSIGLLIGLLSKLTMLSFTLLSALQKPSPLDWLTGFGQTTYRPAPQSIEDTNFKALVEKFDRLVEREKSYAQEGVSLKSLATFLNVPQRQLSQAINHVHGESFSKRMNRLRVREAKRLLIDTTEKSIVDVMLEAGFRTKSNFNKEFLAIEGMSPSDFRSANNPL